MSKKDFHKKQKGIEQNPTPLLSVEKTPILLINYTEIKTKKQGKK